MDRVEMLFKKFPEKKRLAERLAKETPPAKSLRLAKRLSNIVYVPVVFHIVLPNPYEISDDVVKTQIDQMNKDFAGLNADSTNIPAAFQSLRGHSLIQFVLAKRTPSGVLTNGINRVSSFTSGNPNNVTDSIKRTSLGGADAWDPNSYLNIWVGNISQDQGTLGYTNIPGSSPSTDDGVFCNRIGFGISSCNNSNFNDARTIVHELGHYFGLYHIWGDDENSSNKCSGDDFRALTDEGSTFFLPVSLYNPHGKGNTADDIGDTPNQSIASSNCSSGIKTDACSSSAPGIMYQNFMDYTFDKCYSLFTKKQVERMEYVLENFRAGLITSLGGTEPGNAIARDASPILPVNPGGAEASGCTSVYYPSTLTCAGNITPKVLIRNNGTNTINSLTAGYVLNGGSPVFVNLNPNLTTGGAQVVSFPAVAVGVGAFTFKFFTSNVNNSGNDQIPSNDTLTTTLTVPDPISLPLAEGFENSVFPPAGWTLSNTNNQAWIRTTPGNSSSHSMYVDNYGNGSAGQINELRTPKLNLSGTDPVQISFDVAYKNYPDAAFSDRLQVLVSNDCGATFTSYFDKAGADLSTAGSSDKAYLNPVAGDWKTQQIKLNGSILSTGNLIIVFRNTSDYGNNIFIDNISIQQITSRDISVVSINSPAATDCNKPIAPVATIRNVGLSTITGFKVSYTTDNGAPAQTVVSGVSIAQGEQTDVTLNTFTPSIGQHLLTVYSADPISATGTGDEIKKNDTLRKVFSITGTLAPPVTEGFESSTFPPANWAIENPDGSLTWQRTTEAAKTGIASMVIPNFNSPFAETTDRLVSPLISGTSAFDSMYVSFDYAYAIGASSGLSDTLELQLTTDCGQTITTIWKNWGAGLQTTSGTTGNRFVPTANDWRNVKLNLFNYAGTNEFQLYFNAKGNKQNNLYIDNINIYGVVLPPLLKEQGYLIYPNPFQQQFMIRNYHVPTNLQGARIYNSMGQLIWSKAYNGSAYTEMPVDLGNVPAGIYILKLQYTDKTVVQRIVKE